MEQFIRPDLSQQSLEVRIDKEGIVIYGTPTGLAKLAQLCIQLSKESELNHIHLSDYDLTTPQSVSAVIGVIV
jgi:hypothetical protein